MALNFYRHTVILPFPRDHSRLFPTFIQMTLMAECKTMTFIWLYFRVVKKHVLQGLSVFDELDDLIICYKANSPSIFTSWGTKVDEGRYCFLVT